MVPAFGVPGLGRALVTAVIERDIIVVQNLVLLYAVTFIVISWVRSHEGAAPPRGQGSVARRRGERPGVRPGRSRPRHSFMWGSIQSRSAFPIRLITSVVTKIASPGKVAIHQEFSM